MKLRQYIFSIAPSAAHDAQLCALLDHADKLGLHCTRSCIGASLASGTALLFEGVAPEAGEEFSEGIRRVNANLERLRNDPIPTIPK